MSCVFGLADILSQWKWNDHKRDVSFLCKWKTYRFSRGSNNYFLHCNSTWSFCNGYSGSWTSNLNMTDCCLRPSCFDPQPFWFLCSHSELQSPITRQIVDTTRPPAQSSCLICLYMHLSRQTLMCSNVRQNIPDALYAVSTVRPAISIPHRYKLTVWKTGQKSTGTKSPPVHHSPCHLFIELFFNHINVSDTGVTQILRQQLGRLKSRNICVYLALFQPITVQTNTH